MADFTITEDFPRSEIEFDARFSQPEACYSYLFKQRWPDGFVCITCGHQCCWLSSRQLNICTKCEHQHSLTAATIMGGSQMPITYWFKAMWWFTTRKSGINAVNLKELLGFGSYATAWSWLHKLRRCNIRQNREKLSGRVEVDEFVIGGERSGKRGRGAEGKTIVAIAVERDDIGKQLAAYGCMSRSTFAGLPSEALSLTTSLMAQRSQQIIGPATMLLIKTIWS